MNNGDLVVVNKPGNHFHGYVGLYEDRGEGYETVMVSNGCSKLSVYPKDLKPYSFDTCGPVTFPAGDALLRRYPDEGLKEPVRAFGEGRSVFDVIREEFDVRTA